MVCRIQAGISILLFYLFLPCLSDLSWYWKNLLFHNKSLAPYNCISRGHFSLSIFTYSPRVPTHKNYNRPKSARANAWPEAPLMWSQKTAASGSPRGMFERANVREFAALNFRLYQSLFHKYYYYCRCCFWNILFS